MKKLLSKALALIMAAALCVGMCATAFAENTVEINNTSPSDTGTITVEGLSGGTTVSVYQIAKATYDENNNFLGYEMTVSSDNTQWKINSDGSWDDPSEADLAALFAECGSPYKSVSLSVGQTNIDIEDLPIGSYLVVVTGSTGDEATVYGMMIGSVYYSSNANGWTIEGGTIDIVGSTLWAKATTPSVEKTEHHNNSSETHGESANVGDEITYDIYISNIPSYQGEYPEFYIDDTMTNLSITQAELNQMTVKVVNAEDETIANLTKDVDYTVELVSETEFKVDFVVNGSYTLNEYAVAGNQIVIEYPATITEASAYENGEEEHDNDVVLHYTTTSYVNGNEGNDEDKDYEYTFAMNINKADKDNEPLAGATFGLYTDEECTVPYEQDGKEITATSNASGVFSFSGLAEGTYYMTETEAPAGYLLNTAVYKVVITASYKEDGEINSWTIVISNEGGDPVSSATSSAETGLTIINTKGSELPSTGGIGTTIFYIIGGVLVAGAVVVLITRRRMTRES